MGWICYPKTVRQRLNELGLNVIVMQLNGSSFTQFKMRRRIHLPTEFSAQFSHLPWPSLSSGTRKVFSLPIKSSKALCQSQDLRGKRSTRKAASMRSKSAQKYMRFASESLFLDRHWTLLVDVSIYALGLYRNEATLHCTNMGQQQTKW